MFAQTNKIKEREVSGMAEDERTAGQFVCNFMELLTIPETGKRMALMPWQKDVITEFYGNVNADGLRVYRYLYLEIPKKNGKSGLAANVETGTANVTVTMGGKADNDKRKSQYDDYMEILEFGYLSKKRIFPYLAVVYPTYKWILKDFREQYGKAALNGGKYSLKRSKAAARARAKAARERNKGK